MRLSPRRLLSISAVLMLLTAFAHTAGNLSPSDPALIDAESRMRGYRIAFGLGMNPSMFDIFMLLVLIMTLTFMAIGILNMFLANARGLPDSRCAWSSGSTRYGLQCSSRFVGSIAFPRR